jgi:hypothetical protein
MIMSVSLCIEGDTAMHHITANHETLKSISAVSLTDIITTAPSPLPTSNAGDHPTIIITTTTVCQSDLFSEHNSQYQWAKMKNSANLMFAEQSCIACVLSK